MESAISFPDSLGNFEKSFSKPIDNSWMSKGIAYEIYKGMAEGIHKECQNDFWKELQIQFPVKFSNKWPNEVFEKRKNGDELLKNFSMQLPWAIPAQNTKIAMFWYSFQNNINKIPEKLAGKFMNNFSQVFKHFHLFLRICISGNPKGMFGSFTGWISNKISWTFFFFEREPPSTRL